MAAFRTKRLAGELQMRRRRLSVYRSSQPWPGKDAAWRSELIRYDRLLLLAAQMLEVDAPDLANGTLSPEQRAALEDRLGVAGLDVHAPRRTTGNILEDGDLTI